jgi:hypothetical protein
MARAHDQSYLSISLRNLEARGLVTITRTPGGRESRGGGPDRCGPKSGHRADR